MGSTPELRRGEKKSLRPCCVFCTKQRRSETKKEFKVKFITKKKIFCHRFRFSRLSLRPPRLLINRFLGSSNFYRPQIRSTAEPVLESGMSRFPTRIGAIKKICFRPLMRFSWANGTEKRCEHVFGMIVNAFFSASAICFAPYFHFNLSSNDRQAIGEHEAF